jgi:hypothetical protein
MAPAGAVTTCNMPVDPWGSYHDAPRTVLYLTSDPIGMPLKAVGGAAVKTVATDGGDTDIYAPVVSDSLGLIWSTPAMTWAEGSLYLSAGFGLSEFVARYGGRPSAMTLHVKMRIVADACRVSPVSVLTMHNGSAWLVQEDDTDRVSAGEEWVVRTRDFTAAELNGLAVDGTFNVLEQAWLGDRSTPTIPPRTVQVAWFALTFVPPK